MSKNEYRIINIAVTAICGGVILLSGPALIGAALVLCALGQVGCLDG